MTLRELKDTATTLLAKNDIEALFKLLSGRLDIHSPRFNSLVLLRNRYNRALNDDLLGNVSRENVNLEYNQINIALLNLINELEEKDLGSGGSMEEKDLGSGGSMEENALARLARELPVDILLTPLFLVNCDRSEARKSFWRVFDDSAAQNRRFQYYFLPCCPTQQPEGFAERIVHELVDSELDNDHATLDHRRRSWQGEERLLIEPLPLGRNVEVSKKKFKKYFAERFGLDSEQVFEDYLRTGLPALPWKYVVTAFRIVDEDWDDALLRPYLQWLMDTFSATGPDVPNFIFFFIVKIKHAHRDGPSNRAAREVMEGIEALVAARGKDPADGPADAALIKPLPPVPDEDLEKWMDRLSDHILNDYKQQVIRLLAAQLAGDEEKQYEKERKFNMERIEDFQLKVYEAHKNK